MKRRDFLKASLGAGTASLAGCTSIPGLGSPEKPGSSESRSVPTLSLTETRDLFGFRVIVREDEFPKELRVRWKGDGRMGVEEDEVPVTLEETDSEGQEYILTIHESDYKTCTLGLDCVNPYPIWPYEYPQYRIDITENQPILVAQAPRDAKQFSPRMKYEVPEFTIESDNIVPIMSEWFCESYPQVISVNFKLENAESPLRDIRLEDLDRGYEFLDHYDKDYWDVEVNHDALRSGETLRLKFVKKREFYGDGHVVLRYTYGGEEGVVFIWFLVEGTEPDESC